jgi:hypothetical protein
MCREGEERNSACSISIFENYLLFVYNKSYNNHRRVAKKKKKKKLFQILKTLLE